eukprot:4827416-Pyramimonas_sp.AAC.1
MHHLSRRGGTDDIVPFTVGRGPLKSRGRVAVAVQAEYHSPHISVLRTARGIPIPRGAFTHGTQVVGDNMGVQGANPKRL